MVQKKVLCRSMLKITFSLAHPFTHGIVRLCFWRTYTHFLLNVLGGFIIRSYFSLYVFMEAQILPF